MEKVPNVADNAEVEKAINDYGDENKMVIEDDYTSSTVYTKN